MLQQLIDFGNSSPDNGETLFDAFTKINSNIALTPDLVNGRVPSTQLPSKVLSLTAPTGVPADGDEWIIYSNI